MTVKERLHHLVEELPDSELEAAEKFLEYLRLTASDSLMKALALAPEDDEPATPEEDAAAAEAWQEYQRGEARPLAELREPAQR